MEHVYQFHFYAVGIAMLKKKAIDIICNFNTQIFSSRLAEIVHNEFVKQAVTHLNFDDYDW